MYIIRNNTTNKYLCLNKHSPNVWSKDIAFATKFCSLQKACEALNLYYGEDVEIIEISP